MIQVYLPNNTDFTHNGDMVLTPEQAEVTCEINGAWEAVLVHPIDENGRWEALIDGAVVKMPSWNGEQLFRIRIKDKSDLAGVTCQMDPIFFDAANDCFLEDVRPTSKTGQQALDIMTATNTKYSGVSNISKVSTAYYSFKNLLEAISGSEDNSFLKRWGGEIEYDNFTVRINTRLGSDKNIEYRYGKNIEGVTETVDMSEVVTRIYPKAFNGRTLSGTKYVDSPLIGSYPTVKARTITFDNIKLKDDVQDTDSTNPDLVICNNQAELDAALRSQCVYQWDAGIDKPKVTIQIDGVVPDMSELSGADLQLGDTVYLRHPVLNITTESRVVALTYDSIRKEVISITLGSVAYNYFNSVSSAVTRIETAVRPDGSVRADAVTGVVDMKKANLYAQYDQALNQNVIGIVFENNDSTSEFYGAMAIGTQGFMIADTKDNDGNWIWETWGTAKGLNADYIVTGTLIANLIKGGTLTLGGADNGNGKLQILDADNEIIGTWTNEGISLVKGTIGNVESENYYDIENGEIITSSGSLKTQLSGGLLSFFYDDTLAGALSSGWLVQSRNGFLIFRAYDSSNVNRASLQLTGSSTAYLRADEQDSDSGNVHVGSNIAEIKAGTASVQTQNGVVTLEGTRLAYTGEDISLNGNIISAAPVIDITTPSFSSLPVTFYYSAITAHHELPRNSGVQLSNPKAQTSTWTLTTGDGYLTISGSINGSTTASFTLIEPVIAATASTTSS